MNKKFTILTSCYNGERYLKDWAKSIMRQDYRPIEVVFVDDKSIDKTINIIEKLSDKFEQKDIQLKIIKAQKKLYCGSGYNLALRKATGEFFGVLDADDMLENYACSYVINLYNKYSNIAWIYTQYNKYNRKMDRIIRRGFCQCPPKGESILSMEKKRINTYGHWRTFSNRFSNCDTVFKKIFQKHLRCCVDKHLGIRLEEFGPGMFVNKVCYRYRTRSSGEKSIIHSEPLRRTRIQVCAAAKTRRKRRKLRIYPIVKCKVKK